MIGKTSVNTMNVGDRQVSLNEGIEKLQQMKSRAKLPFRFLCVTGRVLKVFDVLNKGISSGKLAKITP